MLTFDKTGFDYRNYGFNFNIFSSFVWFVDEDFKDLSTKCTKEETKSQTTSIKPPGIRNITTTQVKTTVFYWRRMFARTLRRI